MNKRIVGAGLAVLLLAGGAIGLAFAQEPPEKEADGNGEQERKVTQTDVPRAALDALKRVARNFDNDEKRLMAIDIQFYVLRKDGDYCGASLWDKSTPTARVTQFAVCRDGVPSRLENAVSLLSKK